MKNLNLHPMSALAGAGVVLLAGVLSAQQIANRFVSVRVLDVPEIRTQSATWPPRAENIFSETFTINNGSCGQYTDVFTVPSDKWLVVQIAYCSNGYPWYFKPGDQSYTRMPLFFTFGSGINDGTGAGPQGVALPPGTRLALNPTSTPCSAFIELSGYLVDA